MDDTDVVTKPGGAPTESHLFGTSTRGWIVLCVVVTACFHEWAILIQSVVGKVPVPKIEEPFYSILFLVVGYYFGQKNQTK